MPKRHSFGGWQKAFELVLTLAAVGLVYPAAAAAQVDAPPELPNGPAKPGFDIRRFSSAGNGRFETFYVKKTEPLRDALKAGKVAQDTGIFVTETKAGKLALLMDQMAYHHLAEGHAGGEKDGKDWMATF